MSLCLDAAKPLTPHRLRTGKSCSPARGERESVAALRRVSTPRRAGTRGHVKELPRKGGRRAEKRSLVARAPCGARGRLSARQQALKQRSDSASKNAPKQRNRRACHLRRLLKRFGTGPRFLHRVRIDLRPGFISWLPAGTHSGPGRSSDAARVLRCDEARGRRTSSRFTTPHERAP